MDIKIFQFNILQGGTDLGDSINDVANIIKTARADIVAVAEANGNEQELARLLGFSYHSLELCHCKNNSIAILSRWPILEQLDSGCVVEIENDKKIAIFAAQLVPYPFESYELRDSSEYTVQNAIESAKRRISLIKDLTVHFDALIARNIPIVLCGDLNEPSHLDWTAHAKSIHLGKVVNWPLSQYLIQLGMTDTYRAVFPNELTHPGITWTPILEVPPQFSYEEFKVIRDASNDDMPFGDNEVLDRLDFIYSLGDSIEAKHAEIVGESEEMADIVHQPWPSDHRGVLVHFELS